MSFKYLLGRVKNLYLLYYVIFLKVCTELRSRCSLCASSNLAVVVPHLRPVRSGLPVGRLGRGAGAAEGSYFLGGPLALFRELNI